MTDLRDLGARRAKLTAEQRALLEQRLRGASLRAQAAPRMPSAAERGATPGAPRARVVSLSPNQRRLWLLERMTSVSAAPERAAYNMEAALQIAGPLEIDRLRATLQGIVARHEVLRTFYAETDDGDPIATVMPSARIDLPQCDLSQSSPEEQRLRVDEALDLLARPAFDLASGPPLRGQLIRLGRLRHVLLLCVHHIAFDGWSTAIFAREFAEIYRALGVGEAPDLPPLSSQYADYADWQSRKLAATSAPLAAFWRGYLAGAPARSGLPLDHQRPAQGSTDGTSIHLDIPQCLTERVARLARDCEASPFMVLLAAFLLLLHRASQADDVLIGTDIAGRGDVRSEHLIGFFVNVVPLRSRWDAGLRVREWLSRVKDTALSAIEHQDVPFDQIVEHAGARRSRGQSPLVQVLFVMHNLPEERFEIPGLAVEIASTPTRTSKFDLAVFVRKQAQGLTAEWAYASCLYRPQTVERAARAWRDLLEQMADSPEAQLAELTTPRVDQESSMTSPQTPRTHKLDKLKRIMSQDKRAAPSSPVRTSLLQEGRELPLVIEANSDDLDVVQWGRAQREFIEHALGRHAGILFRNFGLVTPQEFEAFAEAIEPELHGSYGDLPKKEGGRRIYQSTPYPERQMILYHNESSHLDRWPRKQWFFCELAATVGGATPVADCREVLRRLPSRLVETLESKGLLYVRTFHPSLDVSWQQFFKTESRDEVEGKLAASGVEWAWLDGDILQTRTHCPAVITHPLTGERSFFNQVQLHHVSCLDPEVRRDLLELAGAERMPRQVYYGDATPIEDEVMTVIGHAYEACAVRFDWQNGDVLMLDNMLAAHARDPYLGPRKVVVAMGAMFDRAALFRSPEPGPGAAVAPAELGDP